MGAFAGHYFRGSLSPQNGLSEQECTLSLPKTPFTGCFNFPLCLFFTIFTSGGTLSSF